MITPKLIVNYLLKKQGTADQLKATVLDNNNNPVKNHNVVFIIHGVNYTRKTNDNGVAALNINLGPGSYPTTVVVEGDSNYSTVTKGALVQVVSNKVSSTITVENLTKVYATPTPLVARLTYNGNAIVGKTVRFNINGVDYDRTTNVDGEASLNINLEPGSYAATVSSVSDDVLNSVSKSATVVVTQSQATPTLSVSNLTKKWGSSTSLNANLSVNGEALTNRKITFNINGGTYERTTDRQGNVSLPINLNPGTYSCVITKPEETYYTAVTKTVTVTVQKATPTIQAENLTKRFRTDDAFVVYVKDINNQPLQNEGLQLTINGITYNRLTGENGTAALNINLNPGTYGISIKAVENAFYEQVTLSRTVVVEKQSTFMDGTNIIKYAKDTVNYQCAIYNEQGERVQGKVYFKVNGVEYSRTTGDDGLAKLPIRLWTGEYTIQAWFGGDEFYRGSSIINTITVKPNGGTKTAIDGESVTDIKSKIYIGGHSDATQLQALDNNILGLFEKSEYPEGVPFTEYEINETDRRTKTAKFTTPISLDLTANFTYVIITNPYHEDFGGVVLSVDYDADKDLYTYQCQDWRRKYISKGRWIGNEKATKYQMIETMLIYPYVYDGSTPSIPLTDELRKRYSKALTGLRPVGEYNIAVGALKAQNYLSRPCPEMLTYDSLIDNIFNVALSDNNNLDIWFDKYGVCHLDPIDWEYWLNTGLLLTTEDMAEYKYGFDTTNILTGVRVKNADYTTRLFQNNFTYDGGVSKKVSDDLAVIFGSNITVVEGPKTQSNASGSSGSSSGTNNVASGLMSGKKNIAVGHDSCQTGDSARLTQMVQTLQSRGHNVRNLGIGDSVCQNHGLSASSKGEICVFICCGICCGTIKDFVDGMRRGYYHYDHTIFVFCRNDIDMNKKQSYAHDWWQGNTGVDTSITRHEMFVKNSDKISYVNINEGYSWDAVCQRTANGQFGNLSNTGSTTTTSTTNTDASTTENTVDINDPNYIAEQYRLAVAEYSKSVRSLMKFSIKIPLNDLVYKQLHTNSFLFTDLPEKFALINLPKIYKNLASYNVSRGVPYVKNRWYIEAVKIKCDSKGLWADVTLNAFPTDQSSFNSAMNSYLSAYNSAFKSSSNETTTNTTNTTSSNIPARTDGCTDCSTSLSIACNKSFSSISSQRNKVETKNAYGKIGREGTNYAEYVKGCTPREAYKKLAKLHNYGNYEGYYDNRHKCASDTLYARTSNCGDRARLLKACMDVLGQPCVIYTVPGHYMNGVLLNGKWETVDLCYQSGSHPEYQTAGWNK